MMNPIPELSRHWWVVALRGLSALIFGLLTLIWPIISLEVLVLLYGAYALVDGILAITTAFRGESQHRLPMALSGVIGVLAGIVTLFWPGISAVTLVYVIALWALVTGVLQVVAAVRLRRAIPNEWSLILAGVLSIVFGVVLAVSPGAGALALVLVIGAYALLFGVMLLVLAWRLRSRQHAPEPSTVSSGRTVTT